MNDEVYDRAIHRIGELKEELQRLEMFVSTYCALASRASEGGGPEALRSSQVRSAPAVDASEPERRRRATPQAELEEEVIAIIAAVGVPLKRMELFRRVKSRGVVIGGTKELTNFGSKLSRSKRLVNLAGHGYWPNDRPFEAAGYRPGMNGTRDAWNHSDFHSMGGVEHHAS